MHSSLKLSRVDEKTAEEAKVEMEMVPLELRPYPENSLSDRLAGNRQIPPRRVEFNKSAIRIVLCRYSGQKLG